MHHQDFFNPIKLTRLGSRSSVRSSISDGLMSKVPLQMRQSLQEHKQKCKATIKLTTMYDQFKNVMSLEKECAICLMRIKNGCSLSDCQHIFCEQCVMNYLTYKINSMEEILCPEEECNAKLDLNSRAYQNLPQKYKEKYKKQQLWYQTMKNPDLKLCPIETCNQGTINLKKTPPQCEKCKTVFCQQCMMIQHLGRQCDQNFKMNFKEWKRCPKCSMFIEKSQGCNHMTCRCNYEFCFVCLSPWNHDHYSCVNRWNMICFSIEQVRYPKLVGFGLMLLIPILIVVAVGALVIGSVVSFVIGFFVGIYFCCKFSTDCCCIPIIFLPLIAVITAIAGFIWGIFFYVLPIIGQYTDQYLRTISNLLNQY